MVKRRHKNGYFDYNHAFSNKKSASHILARRLYGTGFGMSNFQQNAGRSRLTVLLFSHYQPCTTIPDDFPSLSHMELNLSHHAKGKNGI